MCPLLRQRGWSKSSGPSSSLLSGANILVDTLSPEGRSERMSRIRGANTRPEWTVRRYLHASGLRFRLHAKELPGRTDLVLPKYRVVVFVHDCFWHGHRCQKGRIPATRSEFWKQKFESNRKRDARTERSLRRDGWRVLKVWECSISNSAKANRRLKALVQKFQNDPQA
jgi:DNA mismatch endonuclease, patch repair protein